MKMDDEGYVVLLSRLRMIEVVKRNKRAKQLRAVGESSYRTPDYPYIG